MLNTLFSLLRGFLSILLLAVNMIVSSTFIVLAAGIAKILPGRAHRWGMNVAISITVCWMRMNKWILKISTFGKWDVQNTHGDLNPKGWYVLMANHESWMDIPILGSVFSGNIPLMKFFMKKELLWQLPIAGIASYLLGYPFMSRHSRAEIRKNPALKGKDIEATKQACQKFNEFPTTFVNFVEGTRFTEEKRDQQKSPYQHLLKPKSAGVAIVITEMAGKLDGIINATIHYDVENKKLWRFLCGINKIYVRYEVIPMTDALIGNYYEDREYRKNIQRWLNDLWEAKDKTITSLKEDT